VRFLELGKLPGRVEPSVSVAFRYVLEGFRRPGWAVVADLAAGTRQPMFGWAGKRGRVILVVDASAASLLTARRLLGLATDVVVNRVRQAADVERAVRAGGGRNHRMGLDDALLVKENHVAAAGSVAEATRRALSAARDGVLVEVECATLGELREAVKAGARRVLLDNMTPAEMREAVELVAGRAELEASGNVTLEAVREIAETGVDYISVGALTHSAPALDLSLIVEPL
jgi:nicotinate-nucleotide pyrophosphorylase (carboxylating)